VTGGDPEHIIEDSACSLGHTFGGAPKMDVAMADNGWVSSAPGWIEAQGETGDFARTHVLDSPMLERVRLCGAADVLDIGCGEGRFCRQLSAAGVSAIGIDPTSPLLDAARSRDPRGTYVNGRAEALPFDNDRFDMVIFYLTLIDIAGLDAALSEAVRVLRPGGRVLIANLQSFQTAMDMETREKPGEGGVRATMRGYLTDRAEVASWKNISIINHHRPMSRYMSALLDLELVLTHFDEPRAEGPDTARCAQYNHAPWLFLMEWCRPE